MSSNHPIRDSSPSWLPPSCIACDKAVSGSFFCERNTGGLCNVIHESNQISRITCVCETCVAVISALRPLRVSSQHLCRSAPANMTPFFYACCVKPLAPAPYGAQSVQNKKDVNNGPRPILSLDLHPMQSTKACCRTETQSVVSLLCNTAKKHLWDETDTIYSALLC